MTNNHTTATPLTGAEIAYLRRKHHQAYARCNNVDCGGAAYPCPVIRALDALDAERTAREAAESDATALNNQVGAMLIAHYDSLPNWRTRADAAETRTIALLAAITAALPLLARVNADGGAQQVRLNEAVALLNAALTGTGEQVSDG